jgi:hypothetical protein
MNLKEKIKNLLTVVRKSDSKCRIKVFYTSSEDKHKTIQEFVFGSDNGVAEFMLIKYLHDIEKYGECSGNDGSGCIIKIINLELMQ